VITWDEPKRQANIKQHGIDFTDCEPIFDYPIVTVEDRREAYGEQRLQSLGFFNGRVVFVVWVDRQDAAHLISVREATKHETRTYFKVISH
jgi:uncharacterized DUF497 family protein